MARVKWLAVPVWIAACAFALALAATGIRPASGQGPTATTGPTDTPAPAATPTPGPPQVFFNGAVESTVQPPQVQLHLSVLDGQGSMITGLSRSDLTVAEDGTPVENLVLAEEQVGIALVLVLDRGGMTQPGVIGRRRWDDALQLALSLTERLHPNTDLIGFVAVDAEGAGPTATLTFDAEAVRTSLDGLEPVNQATRLYDGICLALDYLAAHADPAIQTELALRRKAIVIMADGLDNASVTCTATDVRNRARAQSVSLYTVGLDTPEELRPPRNYVPLDPTQLAWLAGQSGGLYFTHGDQLGHDRVVGFFQQILSQRRQYRLSFDTRLPQGVHTLSVVVDLPRGEASAETPFTSVLLLPEVSLIAPFDGMLITQSRRVSQTLPVFLDVAIDYPDGLPRDPVRIEYVINDVVIDTREEAPYHSEWDAAHVPVGSYAVQVRIYDPLLGGGEPVTSAPVLVHVALEPPPAPDALAQGLTWLRANLAQVICIPSVLILLIALVLSHRQIMSLVRQSSARIAESFPALFGPVRGRLVVTRGTSVGREFRLIKALTVIGREQVLCDIALDDRYVSARHATLRVDANGTIALTDEGSQNGTLVNGVRVPPRQAIPLPFDSSIRMGETELMLRRAGGPAPNPLP